MTARPLVLWDDYHEAVGSGRHGSGVNHRARQIGELLGRIGVEVRPIHLQTGDVSKLNGLFAAFKHIRCHFGWPPAGWRLTGREGRRLAAAVSGLSAAKAERPCVVWGAPDNWVIALAARFCDIPIIAVPCDFGIWLDARTRTALSPAIAPGAHAAVFCISDAEQWLLRGYGVRADYLPYVPVGEWRKELLAVRLERHAAQRAHDLVLTSYTNPYNREGINHLANLVREMGRLPRPMVLGGYGTEQFAPLFPDGGVVVEGTLSDDRLRHLLVHANSVVIDQEYGAGVSTRIPDALTAGIPVIASRVAARSCVGVPGVHIFEAAEELAYLLSGELEPPPVPQVPPGSELRFLAAVRNACGLV